jgi:hypothetical protein
VRDQDDRRFRVPRTRSSSGLRCLWTAVATVGEDAFDEGKEATRPLIKHQRYAVPILHMGRMNRDAQQHAKRVDENMPFATRDFLARIEALRIERGPPFCAALALWLSMIAVVGLATRPACSRTTT